MTMYDLPIFKAKEVFDACSIEEKTGFAFRDVVQQHLAIGYCVSTPDYFICARPVPSTASEEVLVDIYETFDPSECDCWFVWAAAGNINSLWTIVPHQFDWVAFYRAHRRRITYYSNTRIQRRIYGRRKQAGTTAEASTASHANRG